MNMRPFNYYRLALLCCFVLFYGAWGCEEQTQSPPPQPKVVARKITDSETPKAPKPAISESAASSQQKSEQSQAPMAKSAKAPAASDAGAPQGSSDAMPSADTATPAPAEVSKTPSSPAETGSASDAATPQINIDVKGTMADLTEKATAEGSSLYRARFYNPEGKIDPFAPVFQQSSEKVTTTTDAKKKREKRIPQTPLERISLDQLTLVGVIRMPGGNRAIVQEASGRGYVVKKGTYIGTNAGRVIDIEKDRIVIDEEVENLLGDVVARKQELKLQKPFGEE